MKHYEVAVIGAGIAGLCAGIYLKKAGIGPFRILEKAHDIGGTWRENVYPGVECDVPSHLYSYSFALKPDWSREFASGAEIQHYLHEVVDQFELREDIQFDAHVIEGVFDTDRWILTLADGEKITAKALVSAMGGLHTPNMPDIEGLSAFSGEHFHTAQWRSDVDLIGKRVAVVGTGATAVQCAPRIADVAAQLYVLQRTPVWVGPKRNPAISEEEQETFRRNPGALRKKRWDLWRAWEANGLDLVTEGSRANRLGEARALENMRRQVEDPKLRDMLTPEYNYTCKRPTLSNEYFAMFERDNVELVGSELIRITPDSVLLADGREIAVDVIVFATGFKGYDIRNEINLVGEGSVALADVWEDRLQTYRSMMAPKMPNLFFLTGPNSGGLTSIYQMIESGCDFIVHMLNYMQRNDVARVTPTSDAVEDFCEVVIDKFSRTTQNKGCKSWLTNHEGYPHVLWPDSSVSFKMMTREIIPSHFMFSR